MLFRNYVRSFEALAEIFDFVAGLVHSSKEDERSESDLQNSTARLWKQKVSATWINSRNDCFTPYDLRKEFSAEVDGS